LAKLRRENIGYVFQSYHLFPTLTAADNVRLALDVRGETGAVSRDKSSAALEKVGLANKKSNYPRELSGGEQQRVAVAIALANRPPVLLADEPTGELDGATAAQLLGALRRVNAELGTTIVIVTHDPLVSDHVQRTIAIRDGRTSTETVHSGEASGHDDRRAAAAAGTEGRGGRTSEEFAVLDHAGRLQLPAAHVEALGLRRRVTLRLEVDHLEIWPDRSPATPERPATPAIANQAAGPAMPASPSPASSSSASASPSPASAEPAAPDSPSPTPQPPRAPQRRSDG
jgi:energy-coupling factor transporter ATP-binding protein EcfA2